MANLKQLQLNNLQLRGPGTKMQSHPAAHTASRNLWSSILQGNMNILSASGLFLGASQLTSMIAPPIANHKMVPPTDILLNKPFNFIYVPTINPSFPRPTYS